MLRRKSLLLLGILILLTGFIGCSKNENTGLLQGQVTVGPISPVETPDMDPTIPCEVYSERKIMVYDKTGNKLLQQVDIECNADENYARYSVDLEPGTYVVDINHLGIDFSGDVPKTVEIKEGVTTRLDIDIDTGIR